ncbi:MAG TPA: prepilin-type N-terminal cleavage/methylation domain-containing protein [Candidatus Acidoferrales bacterium]|jgi:general secretion pathway protein G|nr:prepilin-type N-terminal cleavage/methylation domain-containing protein [Candidatus Acidoferrales bacterium]
MAGFEQSDVDVKHAGRATRGFTILELMIVIMIIVILATMSTVRYEQSVVRAHEAALHQDLFVMRQAIQNYTLDKAAAPTSLDDLHTSQYIGEIPTDPITHEKDWTTDACDDVLSPDQVAGGICDVHSASASVSPFDGKSYSSY